METDSAHQSKWQIAEVIFGGPFLISIALFFVARSPLSQGALRQALIIGGIVLIIIGLSLIVSARREFAQYGQPTDPGHPTSRVVKTGIFAVSRNPLYLGGAVFLLGMALVINNPWSLAALIVSIILCQYVLIIPEERYLSAKFGRDYQEYLAHIPRWLGRRK